MSTLIYTFPEDWQLLAEIDESESYEVDQTAIYRSGDRFVLATASGCSCWDGDWEVEEFDTLQALEESARQDGERAYNPSWKAIDDLMAQARAAVS